MQRLRTVTSLDVIAVAGHHAMPAGLLFHFLSLFGCMVKHPWFPCHAYKGDERVTYNYFPGI